MHSKFFIILHRNPKNTTYSPANRRAPMSVWTPAVSDPEHSDGTPPGTEDIPLAQHPIRAPSRNARKE
ncbi:hypothetical protein TNCV_3920191 [Trichonephila clavipes]|nr:hypothetical protein TNCV_3920191 [Trichonephila clavipes]